MTNHQVTILLVDDDEVDTMAVKRAFRRLKIANPVVKCRNGIDALEHLRGQNGHEKLPSPYLILLDLNMPRMSGIEFLRELRRDSELHSIPVVVLTTSDAEKDKIEAYDLNVAGFLVKPVTFPSFAELMATLNKYWTLVDML